MSDSETLDPRYEQARPVWPRGREREMNRFVGFRAVVPGQRGAGAVLRITASSLYRAFLNGEFVGCGPARAAHGYFRVDEWPLHARWADGENLLAIEAVGYNVNSYCLADHPAFLLAELIAEEGTVLAATGAGGFDAFLLDDHVQRVERYSAARTFSEVYRVRSDSNWWRSRPDFRAPPVVCDYLAPIRLLPRRVPYPNFEIAAPVRQSSAGAIAAFEPGELHRDWTLTCAGRELKGYVESDLEVTPSLELQKLKSIVDASPPPPQVTHLDVEESRYRILDLGQNLSGFVRVRFRCDAPVRLALVFDEILRDGDVSFSRLRCNNIIWIDAEPGEHEVESFEPYTMRYIKLMCPRGSCRVDAVELRRFEHPPVTATFRSDDERLMRIFAAGVSTFRQNAADLPTDCPSRERSAWLCDSFYTCRAAFDLTGSTALERNFLENYLLPERFEHLPDGMVAMNYPADHPNGKFIPNWALWLVPQLEEYLARSGDRAMIDAYRGRVDGVFGYFDRFLNPDGLLERLESWVFVEWSAANDFVQDVNYPTNLLYAAALDAAARMYRRDDLADRARRVRQVVLEQSYDGEFFVDNAVRDAVGRLVPTRNRTEVCQYHAFCFNAASPQSHPKLWETLVRDFGARRARTGAYPDIHPANALMGYTLRLELLARHGLRAQMRNEIVDYFLPMADATGTLWEHRDAAASCCHGFASHVCCLLLAAD